MKNIDLIAVTAEELGNTHPEVGTEIVVRGVRYRIQDVKPPKVRSRRWTRKTRTGDEDKWALLVERLDQ